MDLTVQTKISDLIQQQVPDFVKKYNPRFITFLETFYRFLESEGRPIHEIKNYLNFQDPDLTDLDRFYPKFRNEFLVNIPEGVLADRRTLIKRAIDFYRSKGAEDSFRLLFRILFDTPVEFYYPSVDILRASDGTWVQDHVIRISPVQGDVGTLESKLITGAISRATATVEKVIFKQVGIYQIYELLLTKNSIIGTFSVNEDIASGSVIARILPIITGVEVTDGGDDYAVNDPVTFVDDSGFGARAHVKTIIPNGDTRTIDGEEVPIGVVSSVEVIDPGVMYTGDVSCTFYNTADDADGNPMVGAVFVYPGYFLNENGQLSTTKYLHDGFFYQQFSYVLESTESIERYREKVYNTVHPAGLVLFGNVRMSPLLDMKPTFVTLSTDSPTMTLLINSMVDMRINTNTHGIGLTRNMENLLVTIAEGEGSFRLGPTLRSIDRDKFLYLPSTAYPDENTLFFSPNANYWLEWANYQIKDFSDYDSDDIINRPWLRTNIHPEPALRVLPYSYFSNAYNIYTPTADLNPGNNSTVTSSGSRVSQLTEVDGLINPFIQSTAGNKPYLTRSDKKENLFLSSDDFTAASWAATQSTVLANQVQNPHNTGVTADFWRENSSPAQIRSLSVTPDLPRFMAGFDYSFSGFIKMNGRRFVRIDVDPTICDDGWMVMDLQDRASWSGESVKLNKLTVSDQWLAGWMKFEMVFRPDNTGRGDLTLHTSDSEDTLTYNGDGTSGVYISEFHLRDNRTDATYVASTGLRQFSGVNGIQSFEFFDTQYMSSIAIVDNIVAPGVETSFIAFVPEDVSEASGHIISGSAGKWTVRVASGNIEFKTDDGSVHTVSYPALEGRLNIVTLRRDGSKIYITINDNPEFAAPSGNISSLAGNLRLGGNGASEYFIGKIARVLHFDTLLTAWQINNIYLMLLTTYSDTLTP